MRTRKLRAHDHALVHLKNGHERRRKTHQTCPNTPYWSPGEQALTNGRQFLKHEAPEAYAGAHVSMRLNQSLEVVNR